MKTRRHKHHKKSTRKTKRGGMWPFDLLNAKHTENDPEVYRLFTEKKNRILPIRTGEPVKNYAELPQDVLVDLRNFRDVPDSPASVLPKDHDDTNDSETWRDVGEEPEVVADQCRNTPNGCDLNTANNLQETSCDFFTAGKLAIALTAANKSNKTDGSEFIMVNTNMEKQWGDKNCVELKNKIDDNYKTLYGFKKCSQFIKIRDFKIYGHNFKKEHISLIPLTFKTFSNIETITLGVNAESFNLTPQEKECLEKKEGVKFELRDGEYGKELVVARLDITGGTKRRTLKLLQKHKRRRLKHRRTRNNKIV